MLSNQKVTEELRSSFLNAEPFHHIVIDNFIDDLTAEMVEEELRSIPENVWKSHRDPTSHEIVQQQKKTSIKDASVLPPRTKYLITYFSSPGMIKFFEELSGIQGLQPDTNLLGGGVHRTDKGGKLSMHADFNIHPDTGKHRRLNALLYLNPNYQPTDEGKLELWDKTMSKCVKVVEPVFNRLVVFRITDDAYHGHPEPWQGDDYRLSLAFYYYTDNRPEHEKGPFHWADWKQRPEKGW